MRTLYLINPASDVPTYFSAEVFAGRGLRPATLIADLALPTLAALAMPHLHVVLCDESVQAIDFDAAVDYVGITGKVSQRGRMVAIAREFRRRGVTVMIGGPYASLDPEWIRPHCDVLVRGELEPISDELFADLAAGRPREEYLGAPADLAVTPIPAWHLYPNERALMGSVQTSRGCPFECEFCDVIQYLGRRQRHKPVASVLAELDVLRQHGYRRVIIADDNFTASRERAKELLEALRHWNGRRGADRVRFVTQLSIDAARDEQLLGMCAAAGLTHVFIGIETPNADSLREAHKRQNLRGDLTEHVHRFLAHGISVTGGMIVGFDADDSSIFERQYDFAMQTGIPVFSLGALVAPVATPLHARLSAAGRLVPDSPEVAAMPWTTNIVPAQMSRADLLGGLRWLCNRLYDPAAFGERLLHQLDLLGMVPADEAIDADAAAVRTGTAGDAARPVADSLALLRMLPQLGPAEAEMWTRVRKRLRTRPDLLEHVLLEVFHYLQLRYMYDRSGMWDPSLADAASPPVTDPVLAATSALSPMPA
jgi:hypothetical protein